MSRATAIRTSNECLVEISLERLANQPRQRRTQHCGKGGDDYLPLRDSIDDVDVAQSRWATESLNLWVKQPPQCVADRCPHV